MYLLHQPDKVPVYSETHRAPLEKEGLLKNRKARRRLSSLYLVLKNILEVVLGRTDNSLWMSQVRVKAVSRIPVSKRQRERTQGP